MRANLATSIGAATAAALLLPLAPFAPLAAAAGAPAAPASAAGGTQSLSFAAGDSKPRTQDGPAEPGTREIGARTVRPYALLGVVWDRGDEELHGTVRVRTRDADTGRWSGWHELDSHPADGAGGETPEGPGHKGAGGQVRGATAPLWVGDSDGVEARVLSERAVGHALEGHTHPRGGTGTHEHPRTGQSAAADLPDALPAGLRLELIDPGPEPATRRAAGSDGSAPGASGAAGTETPGAAGTETPGTEAASPEAASPEAARPNASETAPGASAAGGDGRRLAPSTPSGATPETGAGHEKGAAPQTGAAPDKGAAPHTGATPDAAAAEVASGAALPELSRDATAAEYNSSRPFIGPRPRIVTRKGWGADESIRESGHAYTKSVRAAFVHHTAMSNNYRCAQVPSIIRGIYRYHVLSSKWRDIGYNFLVDKCGTVYEGRSGGVAKPVMGAHTYGFNSNSTGIAVLGSFDKAPPSAAAVDAVSRLTAWKLGLVGVNPGGTTTLTSGGGTKYKKGKKVSFRTISGHRDGFSTSCPGARLYGKLGAARTAAAHMQGR